MQIQAIQTYDNRNQIKNKNRAFKSVKISPEISSKKLLEIATPEEIKSIGMRLKDLAKEKLNLREIVELKNPTVERAEMLKKLFAILGEKEINDLTIQLAPFFDVYINDFCDKTYANGIKFTIDFQNGDKESAGIDWTVYDVAERTGKNLFGTQLASKVRDYKTAFTTWVTGYQNYRFSTGSRVTTTYDIADKESTYRIPDINAVKEWTSDAFNRQVDKMIKKEKEILAAKEKDNALSDLASMLEDSNADEIYSINDIPDENILPVESTICTIDDINNYLIEHVAEINGGEIFNKPITKDGESLLIGLAHALPDKDNMDKYIRLVRNMGKMPYIIYNQKDSLGLPAIAHVLNAQNKLLFAAFCNCKELKYDPSLEFEFNSITDPKFKELVLNSRIFENENNKEFKTIFGQPNPLYKG